MAVLSGQLDLAVVQTLRGVVDFYFDHGQLIARQWPRNPVQPHSEAQKMHWAHMARMREWVRSNPAQWKQQIGLSSSSPQQSVDDRARWAGWRLTETSVPAPLPIIREWRLEKREDPNSRRLTMVIDPRDVESLFGLTLACMDATPLEGIMRWRLIGEECGRFGKRRPLFNPPLDGVTLPTISGVIPGMGEIWGLIPRAWDWVLAWPVYMTAQGVFTGAAWQVRTAD